jgi:putative ABC transport system ATP-binding protein
VDALGQAAMTRLRREKLGFIFQSYNLIPVLTARENVELGLELRGDGAAGETAGDLLARVGLKGLEERRPGQLSGGQQQRVAAARALAGKPRLVVADEPTANLDSHSAESLLELFQELNRASGVTFLFSSHDPRVLSRARRVVTFRDGRVDSDSAR